MRRLLAAAAVVLTASAVGCGPSRAARPQTPSALTGPVNPVAVDDAAFASSTYRILLSSDHDPKRRDLLVGVVRRQLARADQRFQSGHTAAGLAALTGAFYLLRAGELDPAMLTGGAPALAAGATEVARVGDEGRALAFYGMLRSVLGPGRERDEIDAHLAAIESYRSATRSSGPMQAAGARQRVELTRALVEPTRATLDAARDSTVAWLELARSQGTEEMPVRSTFERDEAVETYRALRAGAATLIALYLRNGDPGGALDTFDGNDLDRMLPPPLRDRLERAARDDDPSAWDDLFHLFDSSELSSQPDTGLDEGLARAAAWGAALELYRSQPSSARAAAPLAEQLLDYGMAEVAPAVMLGALGVKPSAQELSWGMALLLKAMISEDESGEHAAAHRAFEAGRPLLALAESRAYAGKVRPSAARLRYAMGALDAGAGELDLARPELELATRAEPSFEAYALLARIDRQRGALDAALTSLTAATRLAREGSVPAAEAEAELGRFEVLRDQGKLTEAKEALDAALRRALDARQLAPSSVALAQSERFLARTLEAYGDQAAARRATQRALDAARNESRELTATVIDAARRALSTGDLAEGRAALRRGVDSNLGTDDLIYAALWLKFLEARLHVAPSGLVEETLGATDGASSWPAKLAAWSRGKLTGDELTRAARTLGQETEARFYRAMARGAGAEATAELEEVARSRAIELVEVMIARELVRRAKSGASVFELPKDVTIP